MPFSSFGGLQDFSWASSGADTTIPAFVSAIWSSDGMQLDITFAEPLNESSVPAAGDFSFTGTVSVPASTDVNGAVVSVVPDIPVLQGETVAVNYTAGANPIEDLAGNDAANLSAQATTNNSSAQLAGVIRTLMASATISSLAVGRPLTLISWGAGSGGDYDNGTGSSAAGAGGACALTEITSGEASYDFVAGVGGAAGTLGTATSGTASSWSDSGGVVNQANGGTAGIGGATPTASVGGTGGVGDTINNGGNGITGAASVAGGGAAGTSTAASNDDGGTPNGFRGVSGSGVAPPATGGPVDSTGPSGDGGAGFGQIFATQIADLSYPFFDTEVTFFRDAANTTSRDLVRAGTHAAGDRLLVIAGVDGTSGSKAISGWTQLCDVGTVATLAIYGIDSTGSESLTLTSTSEQGSFWMFRIKNADPVANWSITAAAKSSGTNSDPPSHTHPAGSKPILWITAVGFDGAPPTSNFNFPAGLFPTGWDSLMTIWTNAYAGIGAASGLLIAAKVSTTDTEDPPEFTHQMLTVGGIATMAIPLVGS